ncbi:adenylate/guanylate cyclase domain-containing protein [Sphingobacterium multivorum]|nr:adenylate/guanylate cyclase domain-containing protein [Sphingobacterium multivorum]
MKKWLRIENNSHNKIVYSLKELLLIIILWITAALLFVFIKLNGLSDSYVTQGYQLYNWVSVMRIYSVAFLLSGLIGIPMGIMHLYIYPAVNKKRFIFTLSFRLLNVLLLVLFVSAVYYHFFYNGDLHSFNFSLMMSVSVYALLVEGFITIVLLLKRNLGIGYFSDFFKSSYLTPSEEERVFLFLDMIDSTPLIQQLGSFRYSRLMQDCFTDLSDAVLRYNGLLYQFVGDEAVITWKTSKDFKFSDSLDFYFAYLQILETKKDYYTDKYGILPRFRASVNSGNVTIALVGDIKREIAYYGNVLNICSRLQKLSDNNQNQIIISENFYNNIRECKHYHFYPIIGFSLKGIPDINKAYGVHQKPTLLTLKCELSTSPNG